MCVGCKFSTIASGTEFICSNPTISINDIAAGIMDAFFDDEPSCFKPQ